MALCCWFFFHRDNISSIQIFAKQVTATLRSSGKRGGAFPTNWYQSSKPPRFPFLILKILKGSWKGLLKIRSIFPCFQYLRIHDLAPSFWYYSGNLKHKMVFLKLILTSCLIITLFEAGNTMPLPMIYLLFKLHRYRE